MPNRRLFDAALAGRVENLSRYGWRFGLLIVDIDHFKAINDKHGHHFGDAVLAGVAATLHGAVRAGDVVARWGGEEFAVLVESSDEAGLVEAAERLRVLVAESEVREDGIVAKVHVSVGGALASPDDTAEIAIRPRGLRPVRRQARRPQPDRDRRSDLERPHRGHSAGRAPVWRSDLGCRVRSPGQLHDQVPDATAFRG